MIDRARKTANFILAILSIAMVAILSMACVSRNQQDDDGDGKDYKITVSAIIQPETSNINLYVNRTVSANFTLPVIVDADLSMFNTNTSSSNDNLQVTNLIGENIDDLLITGMQQNCVGTSVTANSSKQFFACTFDFEVIAKSNWTSIVAVRKITKIEFKLLGTIFEVPVKISIIEKDTTAKFIGECPILKNTSYLTIAERKTQLIEPKFNLALNWRIEGWGGTDSEDDRYATIVGFRFANSALNLDAFALIIDSNEGYPIPESVLDLNLADVNYNLTSRQCFWGGNLVQFQVSFIEDAYQVVSDSLIMQYTLNGGTEVHEVNLATIQLYDYDTLLSRVE
ncbi:MAG: hypothetical protein LBE09_01535 [Christensenellaceae bacterium]|jgi:hypothetical protein|nr:hypothetical protein [Christensenellaceae bacterium]